jgi:TrpR family trp operon transcriptional repressor
MSNAYANFARLCAAAEQAGLLQEWFAFLFTPAELEAIFARLTLTEALLDLKQTQREMSKTFNISIAKITRGSNALKQISPELKVFLDQYLGEMA